MPGSGGGECGCGVGCRALAAAGAAYGGTVPAVRAAVAAGSWGRAIEVPGLQALNKGRDAGVGSVSCGSAGSCAAGGYYRDQHRNSQGFVISEKNGVWGQAIAVPGLGGLTKGTHLFSVSCGSAGTCAADGHYQDQHYDTHGFVVSATNGVWGRAIKVPGLEALTTGEYAEVRSVSCASPGTCAAGGYYDKAPFGIQGFVTQ